MTFSIDQAKAAKATLEQTIADALRQFSAATGLTVSHLELTELTFYGSGEGIRYLVKAEARL